MNLKLSALILSLSILKTSSGMQKPTEMYQMECKLVLERRLIGAGYSYLAQKTDLVYGLRNESFSYRELENKVFNVLSDWVYVQNNRRPVDKEIQQKFISNHEPRILEILLQDHPQGLALMAECVKARDARIVFSELPNDL